MGRILMRLIILITIAAALLNGCTQLIHKPLIEEQISRPPPIWPPHEHIGHPGVNGPITSFNNHILLRKYLKDNDIGETKLSDAEHP
jgi:hypothetical protein